MEICEIIKGGKSEENNFVKGEIIKRKKYIKFMAVFAFVICFSRPFYVFANGSSFNWYFKPSQNGAQPVCTPEATFLQNYDVIYLGDENEKKIYLTFDAGYENGNVEKTLDILKDEDVPGAFFVLPQIVKNNTDLIKRMKEEGHLVCNHTKSHRNMSKVQDYETFQKEILEAEQIMSEVTGYDMDKFYRPPEGAFNEKNLEFADKLGYTTVFWSLAHADWDENNQPNPESALQKLISRTHPGCVLLLHPTSSTNAAILKDYITKMKNDGYEFCAISELVKSDENKK